MKTRERERWRGKVLSSSRRDLIVRGIWTVEQMGVSRGARTEEMLSSQKLFPGSFLSHSTSPFDPATPEPSLSSDDSAPKRRSVRANLLPVPFMRPDKSLQRRERRRRRRRRRSRRAERRKIFTAIGSAALCTLGGIFYLNPPRGSLPRETFPECN